ncbi:MAG: RNA methyltransferase [Pseudomonadota bacterium]|uniref:RNA methyltransferase n=1 Tax=Thermithiobacillus tepidarius TaxID=929 RepID=UPI0006850C68|nr:RNA methyltransferase [Thermithiobacillus tepidarius]
MTEDRVSAALSPEAVLQQVRVVLVETSHPGNIGATARAMKNMGLRQLVLVRPKYFPHPDATALASGADDILEQARLADSLTDAVADCHFVIGTSARPRRGEWPCFDARAAALRVAGAVALGPCAVIFGRERTGLTNAELDHCHALMQIPSNPDYSSLNLAQAVQVVAYELRMAACGAPEPQQRQHPPAAAADMERFYEHLERVMLRSGFLDPANPRHLLSRLRRLFDRAAVDRNEVNILRGILAAVEQWAVRAKSNGGGDGQA